MCMDFFHEYPFVRRFHVFHTPTPSIQVRLFYMCNPSPGSAAQLDLQFGKRAVRPGCTPFHVDRPGMHSSRCDSQAFHVNVSTNSSALDAAAVHKPQATIDRQVHISSHRSPFEKYDWWCSLEQCRSVGSIMPSKG